MSAVFRFRVKMVEMIRNWIAYAESVVRAAEEVLGDCEVYAFGSVVEDSWTGGSDVDILIICKNLPKDRGSLKALMEERAGLPLAHPFEIHLVTEEEAEWYWRHVKRCIKLSKGGEYR